MKIIWGFKGHGGTWVIQEGRFSILAVQVWRSHGGSAGSEVPTPPAAILRWENGDRGVSKRRNILQQGQQGLSILAVGTPRQPHGIKLGHGDKRGLLAWLRPLCYPWAPRKYHKALRYKVPTMYCKRAKGQDLAFWFKSQGCDTLKAVEGPFRRGRVGRQPRSVSRLPH